MSPEREEAGYAKAEKAEFLSMNVPPQPVSPPRQPTVAILKMYGDEVRSVAINGIELPFDLAEGAEIILPDEGTTNFKPAVSIMITPDVLIMEQINEENA